MPRCTPRSATTSPPSRPRSAVAISRCFHPRSRAATAIPSSSSERAAVVERLLIDHVGHRGDGVSFTSGDALYVPYTLSGETVEAAVSGHPDRRKLLAIDTASPERIAPFCPHFGV